MSLSLCSLPCPAPAAVPPAPCAECRQEPAGLLCSLCPCQTCCPLAPALLLARSQRPVWEGIAPEVGVCGRSPTQPALQLGAHTMSIHFFLSKKP